MRLNLLHPKLMRVTAPSSRGRATARASLSAAFLIFIIIATGVPLGGRTTGRFVTTGVWQTSPARANPDQIFANLVEHNEVRSAELRNYSAVRTYALRDAQGKVQAKEVVRMDYVAPDQKAFVTIEEQGSSAVRHLVLNQLMESEISAAKEPGHRDSSITPANYRLRLLGEEDLGVYHCFVVEALPRRKDKYLFEGRIWIDHSEFAIVKIAGHLAQNPSLWLTRVEFVRQYEKTGQFWLPATDETVVHVKLYGRKTLTIEHRIDSVNDAKVVATELRGVPAVEFAAVTVARPHIRPATGAPSF